VAILCKCEETNKMGTLTIDNKKFVVIEQKEFDKIQLLAAQKTAPAKKLSEERVLHKPCSYKIQVQK
jgi:hypothetical protein